MVNGTGFLFLEGEILMTATIGQTIKKLRKANGWTQEELAAKLNISAQAVSKWETDLCSPDISQIVPLTTLFGISADVLFGIAPDAMERDIEEARKFCDLPETTNEQAFQLWEELYRRYPHNNFIRFELAQTHEFIASSEEPREIFLEHYRNAAQYYEKILDDSTDNELRSKTIYHLHYAYNLLGDRENVLRIANMGGDWGTLKAEMLSTIDGYEEKTRWCQEVFRYYGEGAAWALMGMNFPDENTKIFAYETGVKILDLVYCDGNKAWISYVYVTLYNGLAEMYARAEKYDEMYAVLEKWYDVSLFEDNLPLGKHRYPGNPFLNQITYTHDDAAAHWERDCMLFHLENPVFDAVRGTGRFAELLEKITAMPGIEYP